MSKNKYSKFEKEMNAVLHHQDKELAQLQKNLSEIKFNTEEHSIEQILVEVGYDLPAKTIHNTNKKRTVEKIDWDLLLNNAVDEFGLNCELDALFTEEELQENKLYIKRLNSEYNMIHHLDKYDIMISVFAGLISAAVDILLVGMPQKTTEGLKAAPLSNYIRDYFDKKFPEEEMQKLANSKKSKVPYDAQDNRNTSIYVEGLSAYYHRLLQLGHDPLLGFIFGVADILTGNMTTIDKMGKFCSQFMENYEERRESTIFAAIAKQFCHLKSDITTSMGLPAPFMSLFNFLQFGSIGEEDQTIAEIVQGMYYEGYDFIHFHSMSIPTMLNEVIVRLGYAIKRKKEGYSNKEAIPYSLNRETHPKLATMLFISHSLATAANAGKVYFSQNPVAINYPQWIYFARYSYKQLKWGLVQKPLLSDSYVMGKINDEFDELVKMVDEGFNDFFGTNLVVL